MTSNIPEIDPNEANRRRSENDQTIIIDVRSRVEHEFVGHPIDAVHIAWKEFPDWTENEQFCHEVDQAVAAHLNGASLDTPLLMLCRSGARSLAAGNKLAEHGYTNVTNIAEGFEGDKDEHGHRNNVNGWRFHGLPWEQS